MYYAKLAYAYEIIQ